MMNTESKCLVTGKRKYATEGEALATAQQHRNSLRQSSFASILLVAWFLAPDEKCRESGQGS